MTQRRTIAALIVALAFSFLMPAQSTPAYAQSTFPVTQDFRNTTAPNWLLTDAAKLTAPTIDSPGNGWLRLTSMSDPVGAAILNSAFPSTDGIVVRFTYAMWGQIGGGDGFTFFLLDGSTANPVRGASGGGLGYAASPRANMNGLTNAYVGIGFDSFGNFSNDNELRTDYRCASASFGQHSNSIVLRGSGNNQNGYCYLAKQEHSYDWKKWVGTGTRDEARPVEIVILGGKITVRMDYGDGNGYVTEIDQFDLSSARGQAALPSTFKLGFAASTGAKVNNHEIRDLTVQKPADLAVSMTAAPTAAGRGAPVQFTVVVSNTAINDAYNLRTQLPSTAFTAGSWTCAASAGSSCAAASGTGALPAINLLRNGTATFTVNATVAATAPFGANAAVAQLDLSAADVADVNSTNDRATVDMTVPQVSSITVVKNATGGDATFPFTSTALGNFSLTTAGGTARRNFGNLTPGTYDLTETLPAGWRQTSAICSDGSTLPTVNLASGENVTCTFANEKLDTIVLAKIAVGGDAAFPFTSTIPGNANFGLTTADGAAVRNFDNLPSGTYAIGEIVPAGWTQDSVSCSDGSAPNSINLSAGETVLCTFVNLKQDTLVVEKRTVGGDATFPFTSTIAGNASFDLTTTSGSASQSFTGLNAGVHSISETVPAGWVQSGATCSNGNSPNSISLTAGATVSCVFTNTQLSSITVVKNTTGGDGSFAFTSPQVGNFSLATVAGAARQTFANLAAGTYVISETVPAGWDLTSATCSNGSSPAGISLAPGENVTCSFVNTARASLTVVKNTTGGDGAFDFTSTALGTFSLTTTSGAAQRTFTNLVPGAYDLTETAPAGWRLTGATCSNGSTLPTVNLAPGENVTCTFANEKLDTIVVVKRAVGGDATFPFTSTIPGSATFNLVTANGEAQQSFSNLAPGAYSVAESAAAGWTLTVADPTCSNGDPASNITLAAGETVVCVFVNLRQDTITVEKQSLGGDGAFDFTSPQFGPFSLTTTNGAASRSFTGLASGTYSISETVPVGWVQIPTACDNGDLPASVTLAPGETVGCTFTNLKLGKLVVIKQSVGGEGTFQFGGTVGSFSLKTANGLAKKDFFDLAPGTYAITETVPAGWELTEATCSDGSDPASIAVGPGEEVTCRFENTRRGSLTVVKTTASGNGSFDFVSQALGNFSLATSGGTAQRLFADLVPGSYDLAETVQAGWSLTSATCSDGSSPTNIQLDPGENVTCTLESANTRTVMYFPIVAKK
ncbi:MAG TPA: hypothetical protein P5333_24750 [Caldilinea sp.]|nr:hypothetical protein [Caldilinea sp.]